MFHPPAHKDTEHPPGQIATDPYPDVPRETPTPPQVRPMTDYLATGIAEGFEEAQNCDEVIAAWQYLHTTGLAYRLQGWFGRNCKALIEAGYINE